MIRLSSRALLASLLGLVGAAVSRADTATTLDYFVPVDYQLAITRPGTQSSGPTAEKSDLTFELFDNRAFLRLILGEGVSLTGWSLVAAGNSETFTDENTYSSLRLVARDRQGNITELPEGFSFSLALGTASRASTEVRDGAANGPRLSASSSLTQLASLTQTLPLRAGGARAAGTFQASGYLSYGTLFGTLTGDAAAAGAVLRPVTGTFRASGPFDSAVDSEDGFVELQIVFGRPAIVPVTDTPPAP